MRPALAWDGPDEPGGWQAVTRAFRDGHTETWWAADATLGWWGPDGARRLVVATADPAILPGKATWYLVANLPRPGGTREADSPHPAAGLAEIVRIYGIRHWIERATSRSKTSWAGPTSRSAPTSPSAATRPWSTARSASAGTPGSPITRRSKILRHRGQNLTAERRAARRLTSAGAVVAAGAARDTRLAHALDRPAALVAGMVGQAPPPQLASPMNSVAAGCGLHLYIPN